MDIIRQLRRKKGWSQERLADECKISRATVQRIESGKVVPNKLTALALAKALGVDPVRVRQDSGLAARVFRVAGIVAERAPTVRELRLVPPPVRKVFAGYSAARSECGEANRAGDAFNERSSAAHRERMDVLKRCRSLADAVAASPGDLALRRRYREALARVSALPVDDSPREAMAVMKRSQNALNDLAESGMAVTRLLFQFV